MRFIRMFNKRAWAFRRGNDGTVSVEFVIWLPFCVLLMAFVIDVSLLFMSQSNYWSISRDTARLVARHAMDDETAISYAEMQASHLFGSPAASVEVGPSTVTVMLATPAKDIMFFDGLGFARELVISARITQALEPN